MDPSLHLGAAAALASSLTWAIASSSFARAARVHGSAQVALTRAALVGPILLAGALAGGGLEAFAAFDARRLAWLALSALCSFGFADILFFGAARRAGISRALALASIYPLWTALLGAFVLGERIGPARGMGIVLCIAGVAALILLREGKGAGEGAGDRRAVAVGIGLALVTSVLWAMNGLAVKEGASGLPVLAANAVRNAMALLTLGGLLLLRRSRRVAPGSGGAPLLVPARALPRLLPAVALDGLLGSLCFVYGLAHADLSVAAPLSSLAPLFAVPAALASGDERFSLGRSAAIAATVGGVVMIVAFNP